MRENHHHHDNNIQTTTTNHHPPLSSTRKPKPLNPPPSKKPNRRPLKSIRRNLNSAFTPIAEDDCDDDVFNQSEKISSVAEPVDIDVPRLISDPTDYDLVSGNGDLKIGVSSFSEAMVGNEDQFAESIESYTLSPSSTITGSVEATPSSSSSLITSEDAAAYIDSLTHYKATTEVVNSFKIKSLVNDLRECRESMCQVLNSADLEPKYKKLFGSLMKMVFEESYTLHEEKDNMTVMLSFVLAAIVAGSVGLFLFLNAQSSYNGPPPT